MAAPNVESNVEAVELLDGQDKGKWIVEAWYKINETQTHWTQRVIFGSQEEALKRGRDWVRINLKANEGK